MSWDNAVNEKENEYIGMCKLFRDGVLKIAPGTGNCDKRTHCTLPFTVCMDSLHLTMCKTPQSLAALSRMRVGPLKCGGISNDHIS